MGAYDIVVYPVTKPLRWSDLYNRPLVLSVRDPYFDNILNFFESFPIATLPFLETVTSTSCLWLNQITYDHSIRSWLDEHHLSNSHMGRRVHQTISAVSHSKDRQTGMSIESDHICWQIILLTCRHISKNSCTVRINNIQVFLNYYNFRRRSTKLHCRQRT